MPSAPRKSTGSTSAAAATGSFEIGDIVLGRLKGYPAWPSRVVDPDTVNQTVLKARTSNSATTYCVQFFPAGDFSWLNARDIKPLPKHQIQAYLQESHRAGGELKRAYETALNPSEWDTRQSEWAAARAETEDQLEGEDEDEMDVDQDDDEERGSKSKKRKAPAASKGKGKVEKKAKVEKAEPKPKSKPAKKAAAPKQPASKKESEDKAADEDPLATDPVCIKVKDWRHKLQRSFLSKSLPSAEDMDAQDEIFQAIESYKDMTIEALQYSKIGKVMKKIVTLEGIPRNDELKITDRAKKLMDGWTEFIETSQGGANGNGEANGSAEPKAENHEASASAAPVSSKPKSKSAKPASKKDKAEPAAAGDAKKPEEDVAVAEKKAEGEGSAEEANGAGEAEAEQKKESEVPGAEAATEEA